MGQLERYGLYVLCLVIFLILGVAIWGEPAARTPRESGPPSSGAAIAAGGGAGGAPSEVGGANLLRGSDSERRAPDPYFGIGDDNRRPAPTGPGENVRPEPATTPSASSGRTYLVKRGDSFARIAKRELGDERYMSAVQDANPGVDPAKLQLGQKLRLPAVAALQASFSRAGSTGADGKGSAAAGPWVHTVKSGDVLSKIAARYYGRSTKARVDRIMRANNMRSDGLRVGAKLQIPAR